jgi:hypothetical protein
LAAVNVVSSAKAWKCVPVAVQMLPYALGVFAERLRCAGEDVVAGVELRCGRLVAERGDQLWLGDAERVRQDVQRAIELSFTRGLACTGTS